MAELAPLLPVAHAGHWILYLGPVLVVGVAVLAGALRERRRREPLDDDERGAAPPADD